MKRDRFLIVLILAATVVLTVQCAKASPTSTPNPADWSPGTSPLSLVQVGASPIDGPVVVLEGFPFAIDEPLQAGDTTVKGAGPAQVGILVVDVTLMGEVLGRGEIGQDGRFSISVEPPLIVNHRIGLMLDGQSPGIAQTRAGVEQLEQFSGDGAITMPRIGRLYDAATVEE